MDNSKVHIFWEGHKFFAKSPPFLTGTSASQKKVEISHFFVAFSEYMNFNKSDKTLPGFTKKSLKNVNQSNFNKISLSKVEKNVMTYYFHFLPNSIDFCDWYSFYTKYTCNIVSL